MKEKPQGPSIPNPETQGGTLDRVREVMLRDRGQMSKELQCTDQALDRGVQEAARHAASGELDGGERAAPTAREVFTEPATGKNDLENLLCVEQERTQARHDQDEEGAAPPAKATPKP